MKLSFLPWILFLCSANIALTCWGNKRDPFKSEVEDSNISGPLVQGQDIHVVRHACLNRTVRGFAEDDEKAYAKEGNENIFYSIRKSHGGKGSYGGANIAHHPRAKDRSAASSLLRPAFFESIPSLVLIILLPSLFLKLL